MNGIDTHDVKDRINIKKVFKKGRKEGNLGKSKVAFQSRQEPERFSEGRREQVCLYTPVGTTLLASLVVVPLPVFPVGFSTLVLLGDAIFWLLSFDLSPLQLRGGRRF